MGLVMDLVAGDSREILLAVAVDDLASFGDRTRFPAHLAFGGAVDPTWLDLFSQAARGVTGGDDPVDFLEARAELEGPGDGGGGFTGWADASESANLTAELVRRGYGATEIEAMWSGNFLRLLARAEDVADEMARSA